MIFSGNESCKRRFKERVKDEIIENNRYVYFNRKINDRDLRERICLDAISAAELKSTPRPQAQMLWVEYVKLLRG